MSENKNTPSPAERIIDLSNAKLVGTGFFSDVYRLDDDKIVKVLKETDDYSEALREANLSKEAFFRGVPTAISYDVGTVDGKPALVYEFFNCRNLRDTILNDPENIDHYVHLYADVMRRLHSAEADTASLPSCKEDALRMTEHFEGQFTADELARIRALLCTIPDATTFIHGDGHAKNLKYYNDELFFIDLDSLSYGDGIFDLSSVHETYQVFYEINEQDQTDFLGMSYDIAKRIYQGLTEYYFPGLSSEQVEENRAKIAFLGYVKALWWMMKWWDDRGEHPKEVCRAGVRKYLYKINDLRLTR